MLDSGNYAGAQAPDFTGQIEVAQPVQYLLDHHFEFQPGQAGAQAEMLGITEGQVIIRGARDVEPIGIGEDLLITIGGGVPNRDLLPALDFTPGQLCIARWPCA